MDTEKIRRKQLHHTKKTKQMEITIKTREGEKIKKTN